MSDKLLGPRQKLARAKQHIREFNKEVGDFTKRKPYRLILEARPKPSAMVAITIRIRENIPKYFAPIVGDVIHNLRSVLDHLACGIVPNGSTDDVVAFPFTKDAGTLEATIKSRHIDRANPHAVDFIRQIKPYAGGNDALHGLHILDNLDKHRLLIPVLSHSGIKSFSLMKDGEVIMDFAKLGIGMSVKDGQILGVFPLPGNMKLGDEIEPTCTITFGEGPFENVAILDWLNQLATYIESLIRDFEPYVI